jgi:outer membrane lipoprotein-sorting protein
LRIIATAFKLILIISFNVVRIFLLQIILLVSSGQAHAQQNEAKEEIYKMLAACENVKTASFYLISSERLRDGKIKTSEILIKLQRKPQNLYIYCVDPNPGAQCLWRVGQLNNLLLINPNGFPFFNLKLNTHHSLLRNGQHHTIEEVGFDYITAIFRYYIARDGEKMFSLFSLQGMTEYDGHRCKIVQYENPDFTYVNYTVKQGETLTSIAHAGYVSDYMLMAVNNLKNYDAVKPGQVIKLPVNYGKKIVLYVDTYSNLPLVQIIYDEKGLYEKYEYKSFVLNPKLSPDDFNPENKKYGF